MAKNEHEEAKEWIAGTSLSIHELHINYGIPKEEIASFQSCIQIFPYRGVIFKEGDRSKEIYLLRTGTVGISKQVGEIDEKIATIEAINFFGEMSLINNEPRSATVRALTKDVVVYKIPKPNLHMILKNPKWAELLVTRLSKNLAQNNHQVVELSNQILELQLEVDRLKGIINEQRGVLTRQKKNTRLMLSGILFFQKIVQGLAVVGSKGWAYLNALSRISRAIIDHYLPDAEVSEKDVEIGVVRSCLASIQRDEQDSIMMDINRLI